MARVEEVKYPICIHSDRSVNCGERNTTVIFQTQNKLHLILWDRFLFPDQMVVAIYPSSDVQKHHGLTCSVLSCLLLVLLCTLCCFLTDLAYLLSSIIPVF